jgi:hypothetical protein
MAAVGVPDLVLFVAGEPDSRIDPGRDVQTTLPGRFAGMFIPSQWWIGGRSKYSAPEVIEPASADGLPWHLPRQEVMCVNMVLEVARRNGRNVTVVDVNRAAEYQPLVDRWVTPADVLPLLVRPDGARLEGLENFVPQTLRRFLRPPSA